MKKYILASAILLVFLFGIISINYSGKNTIIHEPTNNTSQIIEEKTLPKTPDLTPVEKVDNANLPQTRKKITNNSLKNNKPTSKDKITKISKKKTKKNDPYSDALDKKIERDIKEISANYPEKPQGIKDEIDDEMIGLLSGSEEIADNDY